MLGCSRLPVGPTALDAEAGDARGRLVAYSVAELSLGVDGDGARGCVDEHGVRPVVVETLIRLVRHVVLLRHILPAAKHRLVRRQHNLQGQVRMSTKYFRDSLSFLD